MRVMRKRKSFRLLNSYGFMRNNRVTVQMSL